MRFQDYIPILILIVGILYMIWNLLFKREEPMCLLLSEMAEEEERSAIEEACQFYDEQEAILEIALREIGEIEISKPAHNVSTVTPERYSSHVEYNEYPTGSHPSMAEVQKENRFSSYTPPSQQQYGTWDRESYRKDLERKDGERPWLNRFNDDDGVVRDPYDYYNGNWY